MLQWGSAPAPGVVIGALASHLLGSPNGLTAQGLGARPSHPARAPAGHARGGRAPHFQLHGYGLDIEGWRSGGSVKMTAASSHILVPAGKCLFVKYEAPVLSRVLD